MRGRQSEAAPGALSGCPPHGAAPAARSRCPTQSAHRRALPRPAPSAASLLPETEARPGSAGWLEAQSRALPRQTTVVGRSQLAPASPRAVRRRSGVENRPGASARARVYPWPLLAVPVLHRRPRPAAPISRREAPTDHGGEEPTHPRCAPRPLPPEECLRRVPATHRPLDVADSAHLESVRVSTRVGPTDRARVQKLARLRRVPGVLR